MLLLQAAAEATHPLAGTAADWMWLVVLLPLAGALVNGLLAMITEWHPGPFDPDPIHTGEHPVVGSPSLVERAERATPRFMTVVEGHAPYPPVASPPGEGHGDHADEADHARDADAHAVRRHPFLPLVSIVGTGSVAAAFVLAVRAFLAMLAAAPEQPYIVRYVEWMAAGGLRVDYALHLDQLSLLMTLVITGVGALIHLFSTSYMRDDGAYARYFAYLNLFVFFMLLLVLGASYPLMFVGWEGVGLCSFLLIGFWFTDKANADAGKKAFIVNRIGDFGFLVAMFLMYWNFRSLEFGSVNAAVSALPIGTALATVIALFLFLGCTGKSDHRGQRR